MISNLSADYRGLNLRAIANMIDQTFGFKSEWLTVPESENGCYELKGQIVIDLAAVDKLCTLVEAGPGDIGHVFRYILGHLKTHHFQELNSRYSKSYVEDIRPYEIEADMIAGWICATAQIPNSFRTHQIAPSFNDLRRLKMMGGTSESDLEYPWPAEREHAFRRGGRMWATGQISVYNSVGMRMGMFDESFDEFIAEVPIFVSNLWSRPIPPDAREKSLSDQAIQLENRVPVAGGRAGR
jgi:hypothetical protein